MQLNIGFTCRDCEQDEVIRTDTADIGLTTLRYGIPLQCSNCGHQSGDLYIGYAFDASRHAPPRERDIEAG